MTTVYPSSDGYFQQDNASCHKAQIISDWFLEHYNEFTLLKCPSQSPDLNPIEHSWDVVEREICIMDVQLTNLQQLRDAIMSIWKKISEECFQHLVESMPRRKVSCSCSSLFSIMMIGDISYVNAINQDSFTSRELKLFNYEQVQYNLKYCPSLSAAIFSKMVLRWRYGEELLIKVFILISS